VLVGLELVTGVGALIGGVRLAAAPDRSLICADVTALEGSPCTNWRLGRVLNAGPDETRGGWDVTGLGARLRG